MMAMSDLKFGDGDGPNICREKKLDVSFTLILVSSNDIITIKIDVKKPQENIQIKRFFKKILNGLSNGQKGNELIS